MISENADTIFIAGGDVGTGAIEAIKKLVNTNRCR